jgi:putative oxidoreductase
MTMIAINGRTGPTQTLANLVRRAYGWLDRFPASLLALMLRLGVAGVFFKSGLTKTSNWELTVSLFADEYKLPLLPPEIAALLGTTAELLCPVMIAAGLGARLGAAALLVMTFVIQVFVYPANWSEHLMWAAILAYVLTRGPGPFSLDHVIASAHGRPATGVR